MRFNNLKIRFKYFLFFASLLVFVYQNCAQSGGGSGGPAPGPTATPTPAEGSCSFNGTNYPNGSTVPGYTSANPTAGQACQATSATCVNGALSSLIFPTCPTTSASVTPTPTAGNGTYRFESLMVAGSTVSNANSNTPSLAQCPSQYKVVGGGYEFFGSYSGHLNNAFERASYPDPSQNGWLAIMEYSQFRAYAICVRIIENGGSNSQLPEVQYLRSGNTVKTVHPSYPEAAYVGCASGYEVVAGGHEYVGAFSNCNDYRMATFDLPEGLNWKSQLECSEYFAHVVCLKLPSGLNKQILKEVKIGNQGVKSSQIQPLQNISSVAQCSSGFNLVGGGHQFIQSYSGACEKGRFTNKSLPSLVSGQNSYLVEMDCSYFNSVALCLSIQ